MKRNERAAKLEAEAKEEQDFYAGIKNAMEKIGDDLEPERMIIKRTKEKKTVFGKEEPALVTIREADFNALLLAAKGTELLTQLEEVEEQMKQDAREKNTNRIDYKELMLDERMRKVYFEAQQEKQEAAKESLRAQAQKEAAIRRERETQKNVQELEKELKKYKEIASHFPRQWENMEQQTRQALQLENQYQLGKRQENMITSMGYDTINTYQIEKNEEKISEKQFLEEYRRVCEKQKIKPNANMIKRLDEIKTQEQRAHSHRRDQEWER